MSIASASHRQPHKKAPRPLPVGGVELKPAFRGWIHAIFAPIVFVAGLVLIAISGGGKVGLACAIFALTGVMLFGVSGMYHRAYWPDRLRLFFKRLDHANIALVIAGTYTPLAITLLEPSKARFLLWVIWLCALAVVLFRVLWTHAPRWLYTPIYVVMGCLAVFYLGDFWKVSPVAAILVATGGVFYIVGAVFYGSKRPHLRPHIFGFHELFHACTVVGFTLHYIAVTFAVVAAS